jgi:SnoaL-like polyketide cyclase
MNQEMANKAVVGRWFTEFWGKQVNLAVVDEIAAPNMLLKYSLHEPRRGRDDIKAFMTDFRAAFPDLNFRGTADLIAEGDYVAPHSMICGSTPPPPTHGRGSAARTPQPRPRCSGHRVSHRAPTCPQAERSVPPGRTRAASSGCGVG